MNKRLIAGNLLASLFLSFLPIAPASAAGAPGKLVLAHAHNKGTLVSLNADGSDIKYLPLRGLKPVWSPDGTKIAYVSDAAGNDDIYVADADGKNVRKLLSSTDAERFPHWSPDGSKIAFTRNGEIWTVKPDGTAVTRVFANAAVTCGENSKDLRIAHNPVWSPDGTKFVVQGEGCGGLGLFILGADGSGAKMLEMPQVYISGYVAQTDWSPDGKTIVFYAREFQGANFSGLWLVDAAGGTPRKFKAGTGRPAFSPDGTEIAAQTNAGLMAYKVDGSGERVINGSMAAIGGDPDWVGAAPAAKEGYAKFVATKLSVEERVKELRKRIKPKYDELITERTVYQNNRAAEKKRLDAAALKQEDFRKELKDVNYRIDVRRASLPKELTEEQIVQVTGMQAELKPVMDDWKNWTLEVGLASKAVTDYDAKIDAVQQKILTLAQPLSVLDFDLDGVSISAEGVTMPVYKWTYGDQWALLNDMTAQIKELGIEVDLLKTAKGSSFDEFVFRTNDVIDRGRAIAGMIEHHSWGRAASRLTKDVIDVVKAAGGGSWPGAVAEFVKKLVELSIENATSGPVGDPNPGSAEVDKWFKTALRQTLTEDVKSVAVDKGVMDPIKKMLITDPVEGAFCPAVYKQLDEMCNMESWQFKDMVGKKALARAKAMRKEVERLTKRVAVFAHIADQKGFLAFGKKSGQLLARRSFKKMIDIGGDLQEVAFNRLFDEREWAAWYEFNHADQLARQQWGVYVATQNAYYAALSDLETLVATKAKLVAEWDEKTKQRTTTKVRFKVPQQVTVEVRFTPVGDPAFQLPIDVYVEGLRAEPGPTMPWGRKYFLTKAQLLSLSDAQRAALVVELR